VAQETDHPCSQAALAPRRSYDAAPYHAQAAGRGVNLALYVVVRACMQPFFHVYFRMRRTGMHHIPKTGPVIFAANHRSFLDPFVIGMLTRRPVYYVAKRELFENPVQAWLLNRLGAFPVERGESDERSMSTARAVLARGDCLVIFPEGTRIRGGPLHSPKRGVGRLALETGAPIVPVAVIGTDRVRRGAVIKPAGVRVRCGAPLRFPQLDEPSPTLATAVTQRVWPCVELQWDWLGGEIAERPAILAELAGSGVRAA
jgi:1-acyl-sn-glycerol-3-phosphate acyltransferase